MQGALVLPVGAFILLAACLQAAEPREFAAIAAPTWLPGYAWTYEFTADAEGAGLRRVHDEHVTIQTRVTNVTESYGGQQAYFLRSVPSRDQGFFAFDAISAVSQDALRVLGTDEVSSPDADPAYCLGVLEWSRPGRNLPLLQFPLAPDTAWGFSAGET